MNILDEDIEMFLIYVLKSLEKLSNITKIEWSSKCLALLNDQNKNHMEKINEKLRLNLKNSANLVEGKTGREKLLEEINQYEKFPNDYRHCIFSRHVYLYDGDATNKKGSNFAENNTELSDIDETASNHLKEHFIKLYDDGWRVQQVQKESGFKSVLYINKTSKQLVLTFKGVQLEIRDLFLKGKTF